MYITCIKQVGFTIEQIYDYCNNVMFNKGSETEERSYYWNTELLINSMDNVHQRVIINCVVDALNRKILTICMGKSSLCSVDLLVFR